MNEQQHHPAVFAMPTDTCHIKIESRQYDLFNKDLGQGFSRRKALVAVIVFAVWWGLAFAAGAPTWSQATVAVYIAPPVLISWFALQEDGGGRPRYALWWDRGRFLLRRRDNLVPRTLTAHGAPRPINIHRPRLVVIDVDSIT